MPDKRDTNWNAPMRILLIIWHYPPTVGGAEKQAQRLAHTLAARGHQVEVWTWRRPEAPPVEYPAEGLTIRRRLGSIDIGSLHGMSIVAQTAWTLWRTRHRWDGVLVFQATWNALGALAARRWGGPPVVVRMVNSGSANDLLILRNRKGGKSLLRWMRGADRIVSLCRVAREESIAMGIPGNTIVLIPNGIDTTRFTPDRPGGAVSSPLIVYVGRFHALKGTDVLLRAFARVRKAIASARLVLAGYGDDRPSLEALATELGLSWSERADTQTAVEFPGLCLDPRSHYARAGVVVLPSRAEGMSNVMLEAMAMGRPIVATRVGGNPDLLDPGDEATSRCPSPPDGVWECANGILVSPEHPEALARGILRVLEDSELGRRLGAAARRHVETHCALDAVAARYETLFRELRGKSSPDKAGPR